MPSIKEHYYKIRTQNNGYLITKFSADIEPIVSYHIFPAFDGEIVCQCPSRKRPCKHVKMLERFIDANCIDGDALYNPNTDLFVRLNV